MRIKKGGRKEDEIRRGGGTKCKREQEINKHKKTEREWEKDRQWEEKREVGERNKERRKKER